MHRINKALQLFDLDNSYLARKIGTLSGGERQRLALSRVYLISPTFIIFDESLDSLDMLLKYRMASRLIERKKQSE